MPVESTPPPLAADSTLTAGATSTVAAVSPRGATSTVAVPRLDAPLSRAFQLLLKMCVASRLLALLILLRCELSYIREIEFVRI